MKFLSPYNLTVILVIRNIVDGTFQSFRLVWLFCCVHSGMPYQLIVSFFEVSFNNTSDLRACSPFSLNVPSRKRVSSIFFNPFYTFPVAYHIVPSGNSLFPTTHFAVNTFKVMLLHLTYFVSTSLCTGDGTRGGSGTAATSKMEQS